MFIHLYALCVHMLVFSFFFFYSGHPFYRPFRYLLILEPFIHWLLCETYLPLIEAIQKKIRFLLFTNLNRASSNHHQKERLFFYPSKRHYCNRTSIFLSVYYYFRPSDDLRTFVHPSFNLFIDASIHMFVRTVVCYTVNIYDFSVHPFPRSTRNFFVFK